MTSTALGVIVNHLVKGHSIWLLPEERESTTIQETINAFSKHLHTPSFPPHITLMGQLETAPQLVIQRLEIVARDNYQFTVIFDQSGMGPDYYQSLYIKPSLDTELRGLRARSLMHFAGVETAGYFPHLSILYSDLAVEEKSALLPAIEELLPIHITISQIALIKTEGPASHWKEVKTFDLVPEPEGLILHQQHLGDQ